MTKTKCYGCKIPDDLFNGVYHLDCFLAMANYPIMELEPIPYLKYCIKKDLSILNKMNAISNKICPFHQKKDCGWHYWWKFPNGVKVSCFHSPSLSNILDFYAEFMMTIPKHIPDQSHRTLIFPGPDTILRVFDYEEFTLVMTKIEKIRFET
ncbi:MAG: hypothetical protein V3U54_13375 [Thermodesulfobacteriota bacterium]